MTRPWREMRRGGPNGKPTEHSWRWARHEDDLGSILESRCTLVGAMSPRTWIVLLAVVLAVLVTVLLWPEGGQTREPIHSVRVAQPDAPAPVDPDRPEPAIETAPFSEPSDKHVQQDWDTPADWQEVLTVRVVDKASGAPIPDAAVAIRAVARQPVFDPARVTGALVLSEHGGVGSSNVRTDSDGEAEIRAVVPCFISARKEDYAGQLLFDDPLLKVVVIEVVRSPVLAAKVVQVDGSPVGGILVTFSIRSRRARTRSGSYTSAVSRHADGIAVAGHAAMFDAYAADSGLYEVSASVDFLGEEVTASHNEFPTLPLELALPPAGSVLVRLVGPDGRSCRRPALVVIGQPSEDTVGDWRVKYPWLRQQTATGEATFGVVRTGAPLTACAFVDGFGSASAAIPPLKGLGDRAEVTLRLRQSSSRVKVKAVDPDGRALASRRFRVFVESVRQGRAPRTLPASGGNATSDHEGRLTFVLDRTAVPDQGAVAHLEMLEDRLVVGVGEVAIERGSIVRDVDLGDVVVRVPPREVRGVVVDETGSPVVGALVRVKRRSTRGMSRAMSLLDDPECRTGPDGKFVMYSRSEVRIRSIRIFRRGFQPVVVDTRELRKDEGRIVLRRATR